MASIRVLILEDDPISAGMLRHVLEKEGIACEHCSTLREGLLSFQREVFDIALVDRILGSEDGLDFVRWARERHPLAGIIIISSRTVTDERIQGIRDGADDYLTKPFEPREVLARVQRLAGRLERHGAQDDAQAVRFCGFVLDPQERKVLDPTGQDIRLTGKEFALLHCLLRAGVNVVDRERLSLAVHGRSWNPLERGIDILASKVRLKLRSAGAPDELLRSVRGEGYLLGTSTETVPRTTAGRQ